MAEDTVKPDNAVKHDGLVAEIIGSRRVVLNKGAKDGISQGDRFLVFRPGEEIHDPKTGESLGILEDIKGMGEVIHVQDRMCTIETYEFDLVPEPTPTDPFLLPRPLFKTERKVYLHFVGVQRGDYVRKIGILDGILDE